MTGEGMAYYPAFLKLTGKRCVVVGGGKVALRKTLALLDCGASVMVISPQLCAGLAELGNYNTISVNNREFRSGDCKGAAVAIAATDDKSTNLVVVREARAEGALVNSVDDPENSDFVVPSCLRRGDITIAISTSGRSPALARKIRVKLEKDFGDEYAALVEMVGEARSEMKQKGIQVDGDAWLEALDLDLLITMLKSGEKEKAKTALQSSLTGER